MSELFSQWLNIAWIKKYMPYCVDQVNCYVELLKIVTNSNYELCYIDSCYCFEVLHINDDKLLMMNNLNDFKYTFQNVKKVNT